MKIIEQIKKFIWLFTPAQTGAVTPMTYEAYKEMKAKSLKKKPCKAHVKAAQSVHDAERLGMFKAKKFLHRCKKCGWLVERK
jgi:hypothetical protein